MYRQLYKFYDNDNDYKMRYKIFLLLQKYETLSPTEIKKLLEMENIQIDEKIIFKTLQRELVEFGNIVKNDYWSKEPEYILLDEHRRDSSYSSHYYSFNVDDNENKKFILISDTHIGNSETEDFKLLHNIYDYGIKMGATKCFHLGDLFNGRCDFYDSNTKLSQINKFINNYPNPLPNEMMTYALMGNRDKLIGDVTHGDYYTTYVDLRQLSTYIPSFYMFPRDMWQTKFSNIEFNFSHKLYVSWIKRDLKINKIEEINNEKRWLDPRDSVLISGHLHKGFIYSSDVPRYPDSQNIFLGVPSTSQINIGGTIAYLVSLNYNNNKLDNMEVTPLNSNKNRRIIEGETIYWNFKEKNKTFQKTF